jgi:hypothetical protein
VISAGPNVIITRTNVISTRTRLIYIRRVRFPHAEQPELRVISPSYIEAFIFIILKTLLEEMIFGEMKLGEMRFGET